MRYTIITVGILSDNWQVFNQTKCTFRVVAVKWMSLNLGRFLFVLFRQDFIYCHDDGIRLLVTFMPQHVCINCRMWFLIRKWLSFAFSVYNLLCLRQPVDEIQQIQVFLNPVYEMLKTTLFVVVVVVVINIISKQICHILQFCIFSSYDKILIVFSSLLYIILIRRFLFLWVIFLH